MTGSVSSMSGKSVLAICTRCCATCARVLDTLEQSALPFDAGDPPYGSQLHWVWPQLVAEIAFSEWTQNGMLRQPRFEGLRTDKVPRECHRERAKTGIQSIACRHDGNTKAS